MWIEYWLAYMSSKVCSFKRVGDIVWKKELFFLLCSARNHLMFGFIFAPPDNPLGMPCRTI